MHGPGIGDQLYRLVTTLHDPQRAPAVELAVVYNERHEVDTACDEIKTHVLGCTPIRTSGRPRWCGRRSVACC